MNVEYTGRQTTITPQLKTQAEAGLARIEKIAHRITGAHVILSEEKFRKRAEVTMHAKGEDLVAMCVSEQMDQALHDALAKAERQAVKHKERSEAARVRAQGLGSMGAEESAA
jgi:putative sigma-54 modulation protein